ncbi:nitroimidazol reductase NimA-like FMN-containing flavoprotein (pyridoxamine 5'-phosphate oxidase superfamily) [Mycobacterium sp. OAS707]|uniref:pyridoxamine 5'-phosphate oxidase family protein n=1 Tax=Mycobacterium sp. OAS707 TaxID=2663822 RepID=UPI0017892C8C|nr:pyridoxamine 5'-phosphate oxidase family protein [Mycobacterium sp. OAS707]MBE1549578.1 nitroimidazol reductase NimA-like FMN-containing flavoprotein (pyridoxamine 5'-phosphate oxidase superfamily) [Mycobacterium sp. OAS707]
MSTSEPTLAQIESDIAELLRTEEIGSLAVMGPKGGPAVSMMHFASDGLVVYLHTFTYSRKHEAIARDNRVSYTIAAIPPDGFYGRGNLRAIQVEGIASFVTDPAEIQRAIEVSREQFAWMKDMSLYDTFDKGTAHHQTFIRIAPVEALWNDNRVRLLWRKIVTFSPDGKHVAAVSQYENKLHTPVTADGDGRATS